MGRERVWRGDGEGRVGRGGKWKRRGREGREMGEGREGRGRGKGTGGAFPQIKIYDYTPAFMDTLVALTYLLTYFTSAQHPLESDSSLIICLGQQSDKWQGVIGCPCVCGSVFCHCNFVTMLVTSCAFTVYFVYRQNVTCLKCFTR